MKKTLLLTLLTLVLQVSQAQTISFGKIESPREFQKYWGLDKQQMQQYERYMQIAGKYRHEKTNPLMVMSMIADSNEDKEYFAQKAAQYEASMVQREIQTSWLIYLAMHKTGLSDQLSAFTDSLTGLESKAGVPKSATQDWDKDEELIIFVDKVCVQMNCLKDFIPLLVAVPEDIQKTIVSKLPKDAKLQSEFDTALSALSGSVKHLKSQRYDRIEHGYLDGLKNQAAKVRNSQIIRKL